MTYLLLVLAYLIGSIPSGFILAKCLANKDIRKHGSGNIGATNAYRIGGKKLGILTLACDMLKAVIPLLMAIYLKPNDLVTLCGVGFTVIVGHMFSLFLRFKGGKGVASSVAALLVISPVIAFIAAIVFFTVFYKTRYVSLASISASFTALVTSAFISPYPILCLVLSIFLLIVMKHKENIQRLIKGKENKI